MDVRPGFLIFNAGECAALSQVMGYYLRGPGREQSASATAPLHEAWAKASQMALMHMVLEPSPDDDGPRTLIDTPPTPQPILLTPDEMEAGCIVVPNHRNRVGRAITWAAAEFTAGSQAHMNAVGEVLNSSIEDSPLLVAIGLNNETVAQETGQNLLAAGALATQWAAQIQQR